MQILKIWLQDNKLEDYIIDDILSLIKECISQNFFTYDNFYRQKDGLAMGNPLSPILADVFMSSFEIKITNNFPHIFKTWHRYVDDVFAIINKKFTEDSLKLLNLQDNKIKFTMEKEENNTNMNMTDDNHK